MYGFTSFYWDAADLADGDRRAVEALNTASPPLPSAGYATHDPDGLLAAYRTLLRSDDVRARGIALDQYTYAEAQGRWGAVNPMAGLDDEILAEARAMLAAAPDPALPLTAQRRITAGWNSALGVMAFLAGSVVDVPRIVEVIAAASVGDLLDDTYAFWALEVRLIDADPATCARVGGWLAATAADARLPVGVRVAAIGACGDDRTADRLAQRDAVAGLLGDPEIRVSVRAAQVLTGLGGADDERVRRTVAGWPADAPYPADEVRRLLAEADDLAQARAVLARPDDAAAVVAALEILAEHGDLTDVPALLDLLSTDADTDADDAIADTDTDAADAIAIAIAVAGVDDVAYGAALHRCLRAAGDEVVREADARLAAVYADARAPAAVRALAVHPYWHGGDRARPRDLAALVEHDDLRLSAAAAFALIGEPGVEPLLRRAAARWPVDAPHPAGEVRAALADLEALAAARHVLAAAVDPAADPPVGAAALRDAAHRLLHDGDDDIDGPALLSLLGSDGLAVVFGSADPARVAELAGKLRAALRWRLADGADDPRFAPAVERLTGLASSMS